MKTIMASTRLPKEIFERIEMFAESKKMTLSSVISELVCANFQLAYTPEEFAVFQKVSKSLFMQLSKKDVDDYYCAKIGREIVNNLTKNPDGSYKRTQNGMYYFSDTEEMRDLITEYLETKAEG